MVGVCEFLGMMHADPVVVGGCDSYTYIYIPTHTVIPRYTLVHLPVIQCITGFYGEHIYFISQIFCTYHGNP